MSDRDRIQGTTFLLVKPAHPAHALTAARDRARGTRAPALGHATEAPTLCRGCTEHPAGAADGCPACAAIDHDTTEGG